jgi:hypothetical protein
MSMRYVVACLGSDGYVNDKSLQLCPPTSEDAITVIATLSFQYLWIDQYACISSGVIGNSPN